jgi:hypothetical protein
MIFKIKKNWTPEPESLISDVEEQSCPKEVMLKKI